MSTEQNTWQTFFNFHASEYMQNCFTTNTQAELEFLVEAMSIPAGGTILDVGCGTGRHSVGLAARGYKVTGLDLSEAMLAEAGKAASQAGVECRFIQADATSFALGETFDGAICICEGSFGLLSQTDDPKTRDLAILNNISASLKPGAAFILTALNGLKMARQYSPEDVTSGRFDPLTLTESQNIPVETPDGTQEVPVREKGFTALELHLLLTMAGFSVEHIGGGTAGNWGMRPLDMDEYELMAICRKK